MASIQPRGEKWQLRVTHKLLPKPFFHTFPDETSARNYGSQLEALLAAGVVPEELLAKPGAPPSPLLAQVIKSYLLRASPTASDVELLGVLEKEVKTVRVGDVSFAWAEGYVAALKARERRLTPGTIRKRVGALARVLDWHHRATQVKGEPLAVNVLRLLPDGYSLYPDNEVRDEKRDLRLGPDDEPAIMAAVRGAKREDRERPWGDDQDMADLFTLIVNTGLRLREAYWLRCGQFDSAKGLVHVDGTKGHRGVIKPRVVPLIKPLRELLARRVKERKGGDLVFPFWDGTPEDLRRCSSRLSNRFMTLFDYAGVPHFTEHDLRHEACCRWVTMKDAAGRWMFNDIEICRILGWTDPKLMLRYSSLRGEDLSARLL